LHQQPSEHSFTHNEEESQQTRFEGQGTECIAIIYGLGKVTNVLPSDDLNACVEFLVQKKPKNILATVIDQQNFVPNSSVKKRDCKARVKTCSNKQYLLAEFKKSQLWNR
jgi:hypothetical protein